MVWEIVNIIPQLHPSTIHSSVPRSWNGIGTRVFGGGGGGGGGLKGLGQKQMKNCLKEIIPQV